MRVTLRETQRVGDAGMRLGGGSRYQERREEQSQT
jgi:hypothetical protein